jgi:hypothetical protein
MKLILDANEVARAVQHYAAKKVGGTKPDDFAVTLHRKSGGATIERVRPIPTLTDIVQLPPGAAGIAGQMIRRHTI